MTQRARRFGRAEACALRPEGVHLASRSAFARPPGCYLCRGLARNRGLKSRISLILSEGFVGDLGLEPTTYRLQGGCPRASP